MVPTMKAKFSLAPCGPVLLVALLRQLPPPAFAASASAGRHYTLPGSPEWSALEDSGAFDDLASRLSSPDRLLRVLDSPSDPPSLRWLDECSSPFREEGYPDVTAAPVGLTNASNYQLNNQPSGLCADHLSCAYRECRWPYEPGDGPPEGGPVEGEDDLNLPAYVVHPAAVGDVVAAVKFATVNKIAVSVKTSGHSYVGASTLRGSILLHMARFSKYAQGGDDVGAALLECPPEENGGGESEAEDTVCAFARARRVPATLRVGGGENWDEAYRAVSEHNAAASTDGRAEYHIVGAGAGTVSATGGWMSGGGLSGTSGMRMFGFGADNVLRLEMVLQNGWHVRFGPSAWEQETNGGDDDDSGLGQQPRTTAVEGMCNMGSLMSANEADWDWQPCPDESIKFADLWFAVRGGAAGYGVVTAAVYQLHEKPGKLQIVRSFGASPEIKSLLTEDGIKALRVLWLNFNIDYFFDPAKLNVTTAQSEACGSAALASTMDIFSAGSVYCNSGAGAVFVQSWMELVAREGDTMASLGLTSNETTALAGMVAVIREVEDYAAATQFWSLVRPGLAAGVPPGRVFDFHKPNVVPTYYYSQWNALLPKSWLLDRERSIPVLYDYIARSQFHANLFYVLGGRSSSAHDHMNAVPAAQREASFLIPTLQHEDLTATLLESIHGGGGSPGDEFPGGTEYNHIGPKEVGPLRDDWTAPCPTSWTTEEKAAKCVSLQEAVWGTSTLARLEGIKAAVDPSGTFNCFDCVGYVASDDSPPTDDGSPTSIPTPEPVGGAEEAGGPKASPSIAPTAAPSGGMGYLGVESVRLSAVTLVFSGILAFLL